MKEAKVEADKLDKADKARSARQNPIIKEYGITPSGIENLEEAYGEDWDIALTNKYGLNEDLLIEAATEDSFYKGWDFEATGIYC